MPNLIQYIVQDDPELEMSQNNKMSSTPLRDKNKSNQFSSKNLLENDFSYLEKRDLFNNKATLPLKRYNQSYNVGKALGDAYNIYKTNGFYAIGEKYGTPSVKKASKLAKELAPEQISDTAKHSAVSCVGASGGILSAIETLGGGVAKEIKDFYEKTTNPLLRKQYGGILGIVKDSAKDLKNDVQASWKGFKTGNSQICKEYLPPYLKNKIK